MSVVAVFGAAGFIGSRFIEIIGNSSHEILAVDGLIDGNYSSAVKRERWNSLKNRFSEIDFFEFDLRSTDFLSHVPEAEVVFNFAAIAGLPLSWKKLDLYLECNIHTMENIIDFAKRSNSTRFIHASTSSVYGKLAFGDESSPKEPISPYGISKLAAEHLLLAHAQSSDFLPIILRYFSVYGPRQRPDMAFARFMKDMMERKPIMVTGDLNASRSNTYIDDVVEATKYFLHGPIPEGSSIYNVCGDESVTLLEAISLISAGLNVTPEIRNAPSRPGDQLHTKGDNSRIKSLGLLEKQMTFKEGISLQIESFLGTIS